jgi:hypothetical protein
LFKRESHLSAGQSQRFAAMASSRINQRPIAADYREHKTFNDGVNQIMEYQITHKSISKANPAKVALTVKSSEQTLCVNQVDLSKEDKRKKFGSSG